ncbi:MAG: hypothetical protein ACRD2L_22305 [Terriglobia bacterium]
MGERKKLTKSQADDARKGLQEWLSVMDFQLHEFIASLPASVAAAMDFGRESLDVLEAWLLDTYPTVDALRATSQKTNWDRVGRYIGETFRRNTNARWDIELEPDYAFFNVPQLDFPESAPTCPHSLGTAALDRRTGRYIGNLLDRKITEMQAAGQKQKK